MSQFLKSEINQKLKTTRAGNMQNETIKT